MRLAEPIYGRLNGQFLTITADTSKGHSQRDIYLNPEQIQILLEMREYVERQVSLHQINKYKGAGRKWAITRFSKVFHEACLKAGINDRKFHCLRHTAAVRLYLKSRDIYRVMKQLGHSSVITTESYTKYNIKRLQQDFPDLVSSTSKTPSKWGQFADSDTVLTDTDKRALA